MSPRARASGVGGEKKARWGLWSLIRRMFGAPKGRHVVGASAPAETPAPAVSPAPVETPAPAASQRPDAESGVVVAPEISAPAVEAPPPGAPPITGMASIRLIFTDGSVVPLAEGSIEGRQAQYLARRVLEAGRRP